MIRRLSLIIGIFSIICAKTSIKTILPTKRTPINVNIYIHGTIKPRLSLCDFFKTLNDTAHNSMYAEITRLVRIDKFFHQTQPMQDLGLKKAFPTKEKKESGAYIFAKAYEEMSKIANPKAPQTKHYTFGWSGLLTRRSRRRSAKKLYEELTRKVKNLRKEGFEPIIRIIGYSHGGNVALHLAEEARDVRHYPFTVQELILISAPIQMETRNYVNNPLFKKVFNFYSAGDHVQTGDFLSSLTHSFGHHTFLSEGSFKRPSKITDIQVRFIRKKILIPQKDGKIKTLYRTDYINPTHTEMFFFGWAAEWYRRHFPIKPLSVALLIPLIQEKIKKHNLEGKSIKVTIIPEDEKMIFSVSDEKDITTQFFTKKEMNKIKKDLLKYQPKNYKKQYHNRVKEIKEEAKKIHKEKMKQRKVKRKLKVHNIKTKTQHSTMPRQNPPKQIFSPIAIAPKNLPSSTAVHVMPTPQKK